MATLNQIVRERKKAVQNLRKALRLVDSPQEKLERLLRRISQRRYKVPEENDLAKAAVLANEIVNALETFLAVLRAGFPQ